MVDSDIKGTKMGGAIGNKYPRTETKWIDEEHGGDLMMMMMMITREAGRL